MKKSESIEELERLLKIQEQKEVIYGFGVECFLMEKYRMPLAECRDKIVQLKRSINLIKSQS